MSFPTWVEIDLDRLSSNLAEVRRAVGHSTKLLFVVKADAYGHGAVEVGGAALEEGVAMLGVATLHEAIELRDAGIRAPLLILSPNLPTEIPEILRHDIRTSLSTIEFARALSREAARAGRVAVAHVEVDTGMERTGLEFAEAGALVREILALPALRVEGIYTHFADADAADLAFTSEQVERFRGLVAWLRASGHEFELRHLANSAGILNAGADVANMARPGYLLYGLSPIARAGRTIAVSPVMSFHCRLMQIRHVAEGRWISYARSYRTTRDTRVGVLPVGYGHGLPWGLSNAGDVLVRGRRARILGRVTMDLTMVDLTDHPEAAVGDEVVLFGRQGEASITVEEIAERSGTLSYEVLCSIGKRVVRVFRRDGEVVRTTTLVGERVTDPDRSGGVSVTYRRRRSAPSPGRRR